MTDKVIEETIRRNALNSLVCIVALFTSLAVIAAFIALDRHFAQEDKRMQEARVQW